MIPCSLPSANLSIVKIRNMSGEGLQNLETYLAKEPLALAVKYKPEPNGPKLETVMIVHDIQDTTIVATEDTSVPPGDGGEVITKPTDYRLILSYYHFQVPRIYVLC